MFNEHTHTDTHTHTNRDTHTHTFTYISIFLSFLLWWLARGWIETCWDKARRKWSPEINMQTSVILLISMFHGYVQAHCFGISTEPWTITNFNFPQTSTSSNWSSLLLLLVLAFLLLPFLCFHSLGLILLAAARAGCQTPVFVTGEPGSYLAMQWAEQSLWFFKVPWWDLWTSPRLFSWADAKSRCCARVRNNWVQVLVLPLITGAHWESYFLLWEPEFSLFWYDDQNSGVFFLRWKWTRVGHVCPEGMKPSINVSYVWLFHFHGRPAVPFNSSLVQCFDIHD